jgi:hypothetical protein
VNSNTQAADVYDSERARLRLEEDAEDYNRSLYTNTKDDHPANPITGLPCGCESGDDSWAKLGFRPGAMYNGRGSFALRPEFDPCGVVPLDLEAG